MKKRDYKDYLQDIANSIDDIKSFIENITFEDFTMDKKTINAVIRSIEVMGGQQREFLNLSEVNTLLFPGRR